MICAEVRNTINNWEKNPEGFSADDFMPGGSGDADDFAAFAEEVRRNRIKLPDQEELERYMRRTDYTRRTVAATVAAISNGS